MPYDNTLGAAYLGTIISAILFGVMQVQSFSYYKSCGNDKRIVKYSILALWAMDALHLAFLTHMTYWYLITHYTDPSAIEHPVWSMAALSAATAVNNLLVRCIFISQLWMLRVKNYSSDPINATMCICLGIANLLVFVITIVLAFQMATRETFVALSSKSWIVLSSLGSTAVFDILLALCLCIHLHKVRNGTRVDTILNALTRYTISTGLVTSLCAIGSLVRYAVCPNNFVFIAFYVLMSKLDSNASLARLNARDSLWQQDAYTCSSSRAVQPTHLSDTSHHLDASCGRKEHFMHITVDVKTECDNVGMKAAELDSARNSFVPEVEENRSEIMRKPTIVPESRLSNCSREKDCQTELNR